MRNSAIIVLCCLGCSSAAAMPGAEPAAGLGDHCQEVEAPCIRQWTEMSASERAHLWPYLDEVSRAMHWRSMSTRERSDMRREMSAADRDKLRKRFCSEQAGAVMSKETRKLRRDERQLLRQQITEFHVQLTGSGEGPRPMRPAPRPDRRSDGKPYAGAAGDSITASQTRQNGRSSAGMDGLFRASEGRRRLDGIMIEFIVGRRFRAFGGLFEACRKQLDGHAFIHSCS